MRRTREWLHRSHSHSAWHEAYTPFGEKLIDPAANRDLSGYTGHIADDATNLVYMQARYYDPAIGRFLSTDPIEYQDQINQFAYVHNDPVNMVDPNGEKTINLSIKSKEGVAFRVLGYNFEADVSFDTESFEISGSGSIGGGIVLGGFEGAELSTGQSSGTRIKGIAEGSAKASLDLSGDIGIKTPRVVKKILNKVTKGRYNNLAFSASHELASASTTGERVGFNLPTADSLTDSVEAGAGKGGSAALTGNLSISGTFSPVNAISAIINKQKEAQKIEEINDRTEEQEEDSP